MAQYFPNPIAAGYRAYTGNLQLTGVGAVAALSVIGQSTFAPSTGAALNVVPALGGASLLSTGSGIDAYTWMVGSGSDAYYTSSASGVSDWSFGTQHGSGNWALVPAGVLSGATPVLAMTTNGSMVLAPTSGTALTVGVGVFTGLQTLAVNNASTLNNDMVRISLAAATVQVALYAANANQTSLLVFNGPTGAQSVLRNLGAYPMVFAVNNTFCGQFTAAGQLQIVDSLGGNTYAVGYLDAPQNLQNGNYQFVITDRGKNIHHTSGSTHTWTVPSNGAVPYPLGTCIVLSNQLGAGNITIAISGDTIQWCPSGTTGSRTLAGGGQATLLKIASTVWQLGGSGLT